MLPVTFPFSIPACRVPHWPIFRPSCQGKPYPPTVEGELRVRKWLFFHKTFAVDYQDKIDLKNIQL